MAYTDKDAIYEIAEKLGYTGDEGLTTTEAVYAVAAALGYTGEHDKSVALALSDLKTVVGGGGGGGSLGDLVAWPLLVSGTPVVGGEPAISSSSQVTAVKVGSSYVVKKSPDWQSPLDAQYVASGASIVFTLPDAFVSSLTGYVVTLNDDWSQYVTVEPWSGTVAKTTSEAPNAHDYVIEMPLLQNGEILAFELVAG